MHKEDDQYLWEGLMTGDAPRFRLLYEKYYHCLFFIGLKDLKDSDLVRDSIQQLFIYLWEKRATIRPASSVRAYLISSFMRRLSADWKKSVRQSSLQVAWSNMYNEQECTPEEKMIASDQAQLQAEWLISRVNMLPARKRELIFLRFYEGLTYDEISVKTGLTQRTIYNRIHEALKSLRQEMDNDQSARGASMAAFITMLMVQIPDPGSAIVG